MAGVVVAVAVVELMQARNDLWFSKIKCKQIQPTQAAMKGLNHAPQRASARAGSNETNTRTVISSTSDCRCGQEHARCPGLGAADAMLPCFEESFEKRTCNRNEQR